MIAPLLSTSDLVRLYGHERADERVSTYGGISATINRLETEAYIINVTDPNARQPPDRILCIGSEPDDETYQQDELGTINTSKATRLLKTNPSRMISTRIPIGEELIEHVRGSFLYPEVMSKMTLARRDEPVYFIQAFGGYHMFDGHHRIAKKIEDRVASATAIVFAESVIEDIRIKMYRKIGDLWYVIR